MKKNDSKEKVRLMVFELCFILFTAIALALPILIYHSTGFNQVIYLALDLFLIGWLFAQIKINTKTGGIA